MMEYKFYQLAASEVQSVIDYHCKNGGWTVHTLAHRSGSFLYLLLERPGPYKQNVI